jgi:hypothetical protein
MTTPANLIAAECDAIKALLLEKNARYGNSALDPLRLFSRADADEQLRVRIDDKISRIRASQPGDDEDVILDLIGYLVLLRVAARITGAERGDASVCRGVANSLGVDHNKVAEIYRDVTFSIDRDLAKQEPKA